MHTTSPATGEHNLQTLHYHGSAFCGYLGAGTGAEYSGSGTVTDTPRNWAEHGYASCVQLTHLPTEPGHAGCLLVECATIHRRTNAEMAGMFDECGLSDDDPVRCDAGAQIEACHGTWGAEPREDMSGSLSQRFALDEFGCNVDDEDAVWHTIQGWLEGLAN